MQHNLMQLSGVDLVVPTHGLEGAKAYPLGINCIEDLKSTHDILEHETAQEGVYVLQ